CVVTPVPQTSAEQLVRLHRLWRTIGMETCELTPAEHDAALAVTSHLPHAVAAALALSLPADHRRFAASGFRDTTRIAAGDPNLWTAIFQQNSSELTRSLSRLEEQFASLKRILQQADEASLKKWLQQAKTSRDALNTNTSAAGNP